MESHAPVNERIHPNDRTNSCAMFRPGWERRSACIAVGWIAALIVTLVLLDVALADWVQRTIPVPRWMWLFEIMKSPGHFGFTLVVGAMLIAWHPQRWRAMAFLCASGMVSGLLCAIVKWGVGRTRPFHGVPAFELHPFARGLAGLFGAENQSFPSGHTCLAFASAAALSLLLPKWRIAFFAIASVVAAERILQGSHYAGDVVAAAGLGVLSALLTWWLFSFSEQLNLIRLHRPHGES